MAKILKQAAIKWVIVKLVVPFFDLVLFPLTLLCSLFMKLVRRVGVYRMPISKAIFNRVGVFPIRDFYYEPMFNPAHLRYSLEKDRKLPGIDWNVAGQLALLERFHFNEELEKLPRAKESDLEYYFGNPNFGAGDTEYLYNMVRLHKPANLIEIGSGFSTLLAHRAIRENMLEDAGYRCRHVCIEPYEMEWLGRLEGVEVVRKTVEGIEVDLFRTLGRNDILFIDSSHIIRPQGDVLYEFLEILPILQPGVFVHVHDIFSPRDYPKGWVVDEVRLYNEQYLLEAFLCCNDKFEVVGALNYLKYHYPEKLAEKCPVFRQNPNAWEPGSFWIRKI